ncbi:MAG: DNA polymerase IV [Alphaproteobacteria bacterium]|nr:DNA polymerase IV [Alphaproteobacteria bacterium]
MSRSAVRKIIHIDMDAFYASVEQRDDPSLRGRPVAVGGSRRRGVVAAASYEARAFGVRSAMPSVTAQRKCPELVFVKPRFEVYKQVSAAIRAIFAAYTPLVEPLSLDEAYLDVTEAAAGGSATEVAQAIRDRILAETGLTASAGVSFNKFLAKVASDQRKPNGQFVIPPGQAQAFIDGLEVGRFHGIGPVTAERLRRLGIFTGADLRRQPPELLQRQFGKAGAWYHAIANGEDDRPVVPHRRRKSVGSETTFAEDLDDREQIEARLEAIAAEVARHCDRAQVAGKTVTVKVKFADFQQVTRSRTAERAVAGTAQIARAAVDLMAGLFPLPKRIRLLGVTVSNLDCTAAEERRQLALDFA